MVKCKTKITQNELDALIEIQLLSKKNKEKRKLGRIVFVVSAILTFLLATKSYFHYNFVRAVFLVFFVYSLYLWRQLGQH